MVEFDQKIQQHLGALPDRTKETGSAAEPSPQKKRKDPGGFARVRPGQRTGTDHSCGFHAHRRNQRDDRADDPQRSGVGHEQLENGSSLCVLAGPVPKQFRNRRQSLLRRGTGKIVNRAAAAFRIAASTLRRSDSNRGGAIPSLPHQTGGAQGDHRNGATCGAVLPDAAPWPGYVDQGQQFYQDKYRQQQIALLNRQVANSAWLLPQPFPYGAVAEEVPFAAKLRCTEWAWPAAQRACVNFHRGANRSGLRAGSLAPPPPSRGVQKRRGPRFPQFAPQFVPRQKRAVRCNRARRTNKLRKQ